MRDGEREREGGREEKKQSSIRKCIIYVTILGKGEKRSKFKHESSDQVKKTIHKLSWLQLPGRQLVVQFRCT